MTEAEWLVCNDPLAMLKHLPSERLDRKRRLFACACGWRIGPPLRADTRHRALDAAERYADGLIDAAEVARLYNGAWLEDAAHDASLALRAATDERGPSPVAAGFFAAQAVAGAEPVHGNRDAVQAAEEVAQAGLIRDIFGNPFRSVTFSPEWRTDTAVALARLMYESRDFAAMPILADALQDAGCNNDDILNHCRGPGPHVRGCWLVDLVLGKE